MKLLKHAYKIFAVIFAAVILCTSAELPVSGATNDFDFGVCGHPDGQGNYRASTLEETIHHAAELGVTLYRCDARIDSFSGIDYTDNMIDLCRAYGMEVMLIVYSASNAEMAARRYKGKVKYYQMKNELDGATILGSGVDGKSATHYDTDKLRQEADNLKAIYTALKKGDPDAATLINGTWVHYGFVTEMIRMGVQFDILGWDWYSNMDHYGFEKLVNELLGLINGRPLIFCEGNVWSKTENFEANRGPYLTAKMEEVKNLAKTKPLLGYIIYELLDEPVLNDSPGESDFGLIYVNKDSSIGARKPGYLAVQNYLGGKPRTMIKLSDIVTSTAASSKAAVSSKAASSSVTEDTSRGAVSSASENTAENESSPEENESGESEPEELNSDSGESETESSTQSKAESAVPGNTDDKSDNGNLLMWILFGGSMLISAGFAAVYFIILRPKMMVIQTNPD